MNSRLFHEEGPPLPEPANNHFDFALPELVPCEDFLSTTVIESAKNSTPSHPDAHLHSARSEINGPSEYTNPEGMHKKKKDKNRVKQKAEKSKHKFPDKKKLITKEDPGVDKKQQQLLRNRVSAQRSREKRRQELMGLSEETQRLREYAAQLQAQLTAAQNEITLNMKTVELLSETSQKEYYRVRSELISESSDDQWAGRPSGGYSASSFPFSTIFLSIICMFAFLSPAFAYTAGVTVKPTQFFPSVLTGGLGPHIMVSKEYSLAEIT